ncbi:MAG: metallophosphoesterase family protein [Sphingobium sp.]|nr:serine/threonine protein phosphatase [Sphingobium sp.]MCP5398298.1 serine/threonine protein phosphatase [Sphingomonas sp.]
MPIWDRFFSSKPWSTDGCRIYAIGDVHGCFTQLTGLLRQIERDQAGREPLETHIVMLGDYVDRGPRSRDVCELLQAIGPSAYFHCLRGNHEQTMLDVLDGSEFALRHWLGFGGRETLLSWGVEEALVDMVAAGPGHEAELIEAFRGAVAIEIVDWMQGLPSYRRQGDYLFVHAGVQPKVALENQVDDDLLWIREPFLSSKAKHPWRVVHGHSQSEDIDIFHHRIGIDTGAYRTGTLTAIGLEDDRHWVIQSGV